jgi:hypothetical protein
MTSPFTHAYCRSCKEIQPVFCEPIEFPDVSNSFVGGDIVCTKCFDILVVVYNQIDPVTLSMHVCVEADQLAGVCHVSSGASATADSS